MITQISCLDECNLGMLCRDLICEAVNPVNQDTAEKEIWENDDAFIAKLACVLQAWL